MEKKLDNEWGFFDIVDVAWKYRKMMMGAAFVSGVLMVILGTLFIKPLYKTEISIAVSVPGAISTRYGLYEVQGASAAQLKNLMEGDFFLGRVIRDMDYSAKVDPQMVKKRIDISDKVPGNLLVQVTGSDPEDTKTLAQTLFSEGKFYMEVSARKRAVDSFVNKFNAEASQGKEKLKALKAIREGNVKQMKRVQAGLGATTGRDSITYGSLDYTALGNALGLAKLNEEVIDKENEIMRVQEEMAQMEGYLVSLDLERREIEKYEQTGEKAYIEKSSGFQLTSPYVHLDTDPVPVTTKKGPSAIIYAFSGAILGLVGCMAIILAKSAYTDRKQSV